MRALARKLYRRSRADRWSSLFGQVAVYSFVVTAITGVFLLFYYKPSMTQVSYHGSYRKLDGVPMSQAYRSTLDISFDVRGGLLMRQLHHWAALLFIAAVCAHLLRLYFTGGFRRPRWLNWLIWVTLLVLGMVAGVSGTILPDDLLSGGSLGVLEGVTLSIPVIGTHLMVWIFGGDFPGHVIIARGYWLHVAVLPAVMIALFALLRRRSRPVITPVSVVMVWFTGATLALRGTFAQVNPVWLFGPSQPGSISAGSVPGAFFTLLAVYPRLDRRLTGDVAVYRPRDAAIRTGIGAAGITFYGLLWAAAANDQIAYHLSVSLYAVTWFFRMAVLAGPVLAYLITERMCLGLARRDRDEAEHGRETGRIVMTPEGGYQEIREPVHPGSPVARLLFRRVQEIAAGLLASPAGFGADPAVRHVGVPLALVAEACSHRRQASAQTRQCGMWACRSHSSPQLLQMATQASSSGLPTLSALQAWTQSLSASMAAASRPASTLNVRE